MKKALFLSVFLISCSSETPLSGAPCPCIDGYVCCAESNICLPESAAFACPRAPEDLRCGLVDHNDGTGTIVCNNGESFEVETNSPPKCGSKDGPLHYDGDFSVNTQTELRLIAPFASVSGGLDIAVETSSISLPCLERVGGALQIRDVRTIDLPRLTVVGALDVSGDRVFDLRVPQLETAGEQLSIRSVALRDLGTFSKLRHVDRISLSYTELLENLEGLGGVENLEELRIEGLARLTTLDGLALSHIDELRLYQNPALANIDALRSVTAMRRVALQLNSSLSSLAGLGAIQTLESLELRDNNISSFEGLGILRRVDNLVIRNEKFRSFTGLSALFTAGELDVSDNEHLIVVDRIRLSGGSVNVYRNSALTAIHLQNEALSSVRISYNPSLTEITFSRQTEVDSLDVRDNVRLETLSLPGFLVSAGRVEISGNTALRSLEGLRGLARLTDGSLRIDSQPNLTSLAGLEDLRGDINLSLSNNDLLADLSAIREATITALNLQSMPSVASLADLRFSEGASIDLYDNRLLTDLSGISVRRLERLEISRSALSSLAGLESLEELGTLRLTGNAALTSLSGLSRLRSVERIDVSSNHVLQTLDLDALQTVQQSFSVESNACLPQCLTRQLLFQLEAFPRTWISTADNKEDCTCDDQGVAMCMTGC